MGSSAPALLFYFDGNYKVLCNSLWLVAFKYIRVEQKHLSYTMVNYVLHVKFVACFLNIQDNPPLW